MDEYYKSPLCEVTITLKPKCYNQREGLFEFRHKGKVLQVPMKEVKFMLQSAMDITSLWTVILDFNEIDSIKINCEDVRNPFNYNNSDL